ncbi:MAG TPA: MgtC/SapB family protein [Flavipsychrobacter sp.]|jgi:putative Mg2+ transporter-C (MgtC) family protein|nr:MgtC/SapB family protein [Flavipsychrobacter sp.]
MELNLPDIEGLLLAALLGAVIGFDREYRGKSAGFRTLMLVCLGAALFSMVSFKMALLDPHGRSDVTRIASNIVSGIGFLGAGIIFRSGQDVKGLTTATTVWLTAAIGMAAGTGHFALAVAGTTITWITLFLLHYLENLIARQFKTERYRVKWHYEQGVEIDWKEFFADKAYRLKETKLSKQGDLIVADWTVQASSKAHREVVSKMLADERIIELEH